MFDHITRTLLYFIAAIAALMAMAVPANGSNVVATIPLSSNSNIAVDVNPTTNRIYTSGGASYGQTITVIDGNTNTVISQGALTGSYAHVNPTTNRIYAGQLSPSQILVYDGLTNSLITGISVSGCAIEAMVDPSNNRVYGAAQCGGGPAPRYGDPVFIIDGASNTLLQTVGSGGVMGGIVVNPATHAIYLNASGVTAKVDPTTYAVTSTSLAVQAVNPVTNRLYAWATNTTQVIDGATESVITTLPASGLVAVDTTRNHVYITDSASTVIKVFDGATNASLGAISLPAGTSFGAIAVNSTTGMIYLISGTNLLAIKPLDIYSAWAAKASMPTARSAAAGGVVNGIFYVAGGHDGTRDTAVVQSYNPAANSWNTLTSMPAGRYGGNGAGVIDGKLYMAGGWTTSPGLPHGNLYVYDPVANSWTEKAALPGGRLTACGATGVINGKLYMTTACNGYSGYTNYLDVYDPATNSWSSLPSSAAAHASPAWGVIGDKLYVAGGIDNNSNVTATLEVYDPTANTWTTKAPMPVAGQGFASGVINGKLYVTGGANSGSTYYTALHIYDPASNTWTTDTTIPTGCSAPASGVINNALYVAGGGNTSGALSALQVYTLSGSTTQKLKVLVAGGMSNSSGAATAPATAEVYDEAAGTWSATANNIAYGTVPTKGVCNATMTLLGSGKVLFAGGGCGGDDGTTTNAASIYDPSTNQWSAAAAMSYGRAGFCLVKLADGSAMALGGCAGGCSGPNILGQYVGTVGRSAEIYDQSANHWSTVHTMGTVRAWLGNATTFQKAITLQDGRVLACGGSDGFSSTYTSCEIYDSAANTWAATINSFPEVGSPTSLALLQDGKVLAALNSSQGAVLFDPATKAWTATGAPSSIQSWAQITVLKNGEVLMSGGNGSSGGTTSALATAQIYNPNTGAWRTTGSMSVGRYGHFAVLLSDGKVLAAGGYSGNSTSWAPVASAEIFDPATGTWSATGAMAQARTYPSAVLLQTQAAATTYSLTVTKSGTGTGSVSADTGTLSWSGNTAAAAYNSGQSVTLTATPNSGTTFDGWSGDCSGTGTCTLNMVGNRSVTATFNLIPVDATPPTNASIVINSGAATTGSQQVLLTLAATDPSGMGQMKFSNDLSTWSDPIAFANAAAWNLSAGNGAKTVWAKFSDSLDNWMTTPVTATIFLAVTVVPQTPAGLEITEITNDTATLRWTKNAEAGVIYDVFRSETQDGLYYKINTNPIGDDSISFGKVYFTDKELREGTSYYYKVQANLSGVTSAALSAATSDSTLAIDDYIVGIADPTNIVNIGSTVKYYIQILPKDKFQGTINLSCSGVSSNITYEFLIGDQSKGASVSGVALPASVVLKVTAGSAALIKEHTFQLLTQNVWDGGGSDQRSAPLMLLVLDRYGAGIHLEVEKAIYRMGEKVKLFGSILPPLSGKTVTLALTKATGTQTKTVLTTSGGKFQDTDWLSSLDIGTYTIAASWVDDSTTTRTSIVRAFTVEKGGPALTCVRRTGEIPGVGKDFTVQGGMKPALAYAPVTLRLYAPDGTFIDRAFALDGDGQYQLVDKFFTRKGLWKFKIYYLGNEKYIGTESEMLVVPVEVEAGRAIILGGGVAEQTNTYWAVTKKLVADVYKDFKNKGFTNDMIWLMINSVGIDINNDLNDDPVVDVNPPTVTAFLNAIQYQYAAQLNADTPLFIYMFGHGTNDGRFRVLGDDQYLSAAQMKAALDQLQAATGCPVVIIVESCYSGTFISGLISTTYKRVVLTSADSLHPYRVDDTGRNTFSTFLFSKLIEGDDFRKAFNYAKSTLVNMGYPAPQLDDGVSGTLAANTYLRGELTMGLKPVINETTLPVILDGVSSTAISVSVTRGDVALDKVWIQVMAPNAVLTDQEGTLSYPQFILTWNSTTGKYEGTISNLNVSGMYKIIVYAQDVNQEVSNPAISYITVQGVGSPGDVNGDQNVTLADAVLALQITAGMSPSGSITVAADVNGDGKIGLAEAIYILQKTAGVR